MPSRAVIFGFCCVHYILIVTYSTLISGPFVGGERCGSEFPLPNGDPSKCDPNKKDEPCCSVSGWCSDGSSWCSCAGCVDYRVVAREEGCTSLPSHVTSLADLPVLVDTVIAVTLVCSGFGYNAEGVPFTCKADKSWGRDMEPTCRDIGKQYRVLVLKA